MKILAIDQSLTSSGFWIDEEVNGLIKTTPKQTQQQRLCIARAIAVKPEIILMDEPASALDPIATMKIEELMTKLAQNYTIIIVTHNMQQASRISNFTAFLMADSNRSGYLVEYSKTEELFVTPKDKRTEDYISGRFG